MGLLFLSLGFVASGMAGAQTATSGPGVYGSQVAAGDYDDVPVVTAASYAVTVKEVDLGQAGQGSDNCLLLAMSTGGAYVATKAQINDIRLTPCDGKAAGTLIDGKSTNELAWTYAAPALTPTESVQYVDLNGNLRYDKGDAVYITTSAADGLTASGAAGAWSVRVTPAMGKAFGTLVFASDADFNVYGAYAKQISATGGSVAGREDGNKFLVPTGAGGVAKYGLIPLNSVRLAQPSIVDIRALNVTLTPAQPVAGQPFTILVGLQNAGKLYGSTVLTTKLNGAIVDTRATPALSANGTGWIAMTLSAPSSAGTANLTVGTLSQDVTVVAGGAASPAPSSDQAAQIQALSQRVDSLQSQLTATQSQLSDANAKLTALQDAVAKLGTPLKSSSDTVSSPGSSVSGASKATPGVSAALVVAVGLSVALLAARRRQP